MSGQWSGNWKITALVLERSQATGATLLVALAIAHLANRRDDDWTTASLRTLALWSTCDKQTVVRAIPALEALGELEVQRGGVGGPNDARQNRYRIDTAALKRLPRRPAQGGRVVRPRGGRVGRPPTDERAHGGGRVVRPRVVASVDHGGRVGRPRVVDSVRSFAPTRVKQSLTEKQSDSSSEESRGADAPVDVVTIDQSVAKGETTNTFASAHVSNGTRGDDSVVEPFSEDLSQQPAAPVQASEERSAGQATVNAPYVAPFADSPRIRAGWLAILATLADHELHDQVELLAVAAGSSGQLAASSVHHLLTAAERAGAVQRTRDKHHRGDHALVRLRPTCPPAWLNTPAPPVDLAEQARVELARLVGTDRLRPTLDALGWDEVIYPQATLWLAHQDRQKLVEIIAAAREAHPRTEAAS